MQHLNIVVIALRRRGAASKHHGGEGYAEHINYKGVINIGTGRFGGMYVGRKVRWSRVVGT